MSVDVARCVWVLFPWSAFIWRVDVARSGTSGACSSVAVASLRLARRTPGLPSRPGIPGRRGLRILSRGAPLSPLRHLPVTMSSRDARGRRGLPKPHGSQRPRDAPAAARPCRARPQRPSRSLPGTDFDYLCPEWVEPRAARPCRPPAQGTRPCNQRSSSCRSPARCVRVQPMRASPASSSGSPGRGAEQGSRTPHHRQRRRGRGRALRARPARSDRGCGRRRGGA